MTATQPASVDGIDPAPRFTLSTDLCLQFVEAGLSLRDIQACSLVSRHWHQIWEATISEYPLFFLKRFFPNSCDPMRRSTEAGTHKAPAKEPDLKLKRKRSGLSFEETRAVRHLYLKKCVRERLACMLDICEATLFSPEMPQDELPKPGKSYNFEQEAAASSSLRAPLTSRKRGTFTCHDGLVAWNLDDNRFVVDDLRETTWQLFQVARSEGHEWTGRPIEVACLTKEMLVTVTNPESWQTEDGTTKSAVEVYVHNLQTGAQIRFQHNEPTGMVATFHAIGHDVVTFCNNSQRIVRYRMKWHGDCLDAAEGDVLKVNEIKLPDGHHSYMFFEGENSDTIFTVIQGEGDEDTLIYEYLHYSLRTEHRGSSALPKKSSNLSREKYWKCQQADSRGAIELFTSTLIGTNQHFVHCSFFFSIPQRSFHWRYHRLCGHSGVRWDGWNYHLHAHFAYHSNGTRCDRPRKDVRAYQCTTPTATLDADPALEHPDIMWFKGSDEISSLIIDDEDFEGYEVCVDDEFVVFWEAWRGPYGVLTRKRGKGKEAEGGTIMRRTLHPRDVNVRA